MADRTSREYRIEAVRNRPQYEGLRALWCDVFGDPPEFVDAVYDALEDICGFAMADPSGKVISSLTCYRCGVYKEPASGGGACGSESDGLNRIPVYVSYAICTRPEFRGLGLAGRLTSLARDIVTADPEIVFTLDDGTKINGKGGISIVSPAEPSLEAYYMEYGYRPCFFAKELEAVCGDEEDWSSLEDIGECSSAKISFWNGEDSEACEDSGLRIELRAAEPHIYNKYREKFLAEVPHIEAGEDLLALLKGDIGSGQPDGLYLVNNGDAVVTISCGEEGPAIEELIADPRLVSLSSEIEEEIACAIAEKLGVESIRYRTPGEGYCQAMMAGGRTLPGDNEERAYFGFPID